MTRYERKRNGLSRWPQRSRQNLRDRTWLSLKCRDEHFSADELRDQWRAAQVSDLRTTKREKHELLSDFGGWRMKTALRQSPRSSNPQLCASFILDDVQQHGLIHLSFLW
jgi:hypothetical protein